MLYMLLMQLKLVWEQGEYEVCLYVRMTHGIESSEVKAVLVN